MGAGLCTTDYNPTCLHLSVTTEGYMLGLGNLFCFSQIIHRSLCNLWNEYGLNGLNYRLHNTWHILDMGLVAVGCSRHIVRICFSFTFLDSSCFRTFAKKTGSHSQRVQVPKDLGPKKHQWYGFWNQNPSILGTWTFWDWDNPVMTPLPRIPRAAVHEQLSTELLINRSATTGDLVGAHRRHARIMVLAYMYMCMYTCRPLYALLCSHFQIQQRPQVQVTIQCHKSRSEDGRA